MHAAYVIKIILVTVHDMKILFSQTAIKIQF